MTWCRENQGEVIAMQHVFFYHLYCIVEFQIKLKVVFSCYRTGVLSMCKCFKCIFLNLSEPFPFKNFLPFENNNFTCVNAYRDIHLHYVDWFSFVQQESALSKTSEDVVEVIRICLNFPVFEMRNAILAFFLGVHQNSIQN